MTSPSLMVRILGDAAALGSTFGAVAEKGKSAAAGIHSAFSGMLGTLNSTGVLGPFGAALQTADQSLQQMEGHAKSTSDKMIGLGGASAGVGLALSALGSKDQAAHQQLQASIAATGHSYDQFATKIDAAVGHQEKFGHTADETDNALQSLTQATHNPTEALKLLNTASDLAAAKHESLEAAATSLGKAYNGSGRALKDFGITVSATGSAQKELEKATTGAQKADDTLATSKRALAELEAEDASKKSLTTVEAMKLQDAQNKVATATLSAKGAHEQLNQAQKDVASGTSANTKALDELSGKLKGQASAATDTFKGRMDALKATVQDHISLFGQKYGKAISTAGLAMAGLGSVMKGAEGATKALKDSQVIQSAATKTATAIQWLFNAAMDANVIVIVVLAIVALIAIVILLYTHFKIVRDVIDDVWQFMKKAWADILSIISGVFNWIKDNWPLLLAILLGPFALAVLLIVENWHTILKFFEDLPGNILQALGNLAGLLLGVGMDIIHGLEAGLKWVWDNEVTGWLDIGSKIKSIIGTLGALLFDVGKSIIKGLLDGMKNAWTDVTGWMGDMGSKIKGFITNPLSIFSPSKVMAEVGQNIMAGLGLGLQSGFGQHVVPALAQTVDTLLAPTSGSSGTSGALAVPQGRSGPAVVVHHQTFNSGVDVDAFMQKAAWHMRTRRP
jgi:hypothetical protein